MKKIVIALAVALLIAAWFYSDHKTEAEVAPYLKQAMPLAANFDKVSGSPPTFKAKDTDGQVFGYVVFGEANGYGGPLKVAVAVDPKGKILETIIVDNKETPAYLSMVLRNKFLEKIKEKSVGSTFELGEDLDGVSGATISSGAIAEAVRKASHDVGRRQLNLNIADKQENWRIGIPEIAVMLLYLFTIIFAFVWKKPNFRNYVVWASIIILGFWLNRPISLSYISGALLGYFPAFHQNLLWYVVLFGGVGMAVFSGRNIYCAWLCPFLGVQELANRVSGVRCSANGAENKLRSTRNILLWFGLFLAFIYRNPALGSYEPFGTIFGFTGTGLAWLLLAAVLVAAIFKFRFWCGYFCPVGATLDICAKINRTVKKLVNNVPSRGIKEDTMS